MILHSNEEIFKKFVEIFRCLNGTGNIMEILECNVVYKHCHGPLIVDMVKHIPLFEDFSFYNQNTT